MDKLLFLGSSTDTNYALEYCRRLGVHSIVTDYVPYEKSPAKQLADEYWSIDLADLDALEAKCREVGITGVYAGNHEYCLDQTRLLAKRLGLPFYASDEGWLCSRDKARFKEQCIAAGLDVPKRFPLQKPFSRADLDAVVYPVIVKPVDSCSSRGITVCRNESELLTAYDYALGFSARKEVIVEEYLEGPTIAALYYFDDGKVNLTHLNTGFHTVKDGKTTNSGFLVAIQKQGVLSYNAEMETRVRKLFENMGCQHGMAFLQAVCKDGKFYPFEMGYRLDGLCQWSVTKPLFGFSALEAMVDYALGRRYEYHGESVLKTDGDKLGVLLTVWANPGKVVRVENDVLREEDGVVCSLERYRAGMEVTPAASMCQIAYYLTVLASSADELIEKIRVLNERLGLFDENGRNLLVPFLRLNELKDYLNREMPFSGNE